jgi:hypothetical protein
MIKTDANITAAAAMQDAKPVIVNICSAKEVIPALEKMTLLHAGPPIAWKDMLEIQRGAVIGAVLYEGWASTPEQASKMAADGMIHLIPCNDVNSVGGLAGVTSPSMPVVVAASSDNRYQAFCRLWEPFLVFGYHDSKTIQSLKWLEKIFAPALKTGIEQIGPVEITSLIASALQMGDDTHSRKIATSLLLIRSILPGMTKAIDQIIDFDSVIKFWTNYDAVSLSFVIAAAKVMSLSASSIKGSSVITVICTNGVETGIQLSGTGNHWFTGPAPVISGKYTNGFTVQDASAAVGDSAIAEVVGLGGCALAASPKAPSNISGRVDEAIKYSMDAQKIAVSQNQLWHLPALDDIGTPLGLDARICVDLSMSPPLAATIPNIKAGCSPVGAGMGKVDKEILISAINYLDGHLPNKKENSPYQGK